MEITDNQISLRSELKRKMIHLFSSVIPFSYYLLERKTMLSILIAMFIAMLVIDVLRVKNQKVKYLYIKFLGDILRRHETEKEKIFFTGGTYLIFAFLICVLIFEKNIAILSMFILIFCDTTAAIVGRKKGKHFIGQKTIEGSLAFFFTGIIILFLVIGITDLKFLFAGTIALFVTTLFELIPLNSIKSFKIDDNITIPVFFGIAFTLISNSNFLI